MNVTSEKKQVVVDLSAVLKPLSTQLSTPDLLVKDHSSQNVLLQLQHRLNDLQDVTQRLQFMLGEINPLIKKRKF